MPHHAKLKTPGALKDRPAVVITAFGTTRPGKAAYDRFDSDVRAAYPDHDIRWAYTSAIVRRKTGQPGLVEQLAALSAEGYATAVVLPLLVFPGTEYQLMKEACESFPGMRITVGETLMHRWSFVDEVLDIIEPDFLSEDDGVTLIVAHGTSLAADAATGVYLGVEHVVSGRYPGVYFCAVEGVPDRTAVMNRLRREQNGGAGKTARLLPFMYVAGLHVEEDLVGEEDSLKVELEELGYRVDLPEADVDGQALPRGLGLTPGINACFINRLDRAMNISTRT